MCIVATNINTENIAKQVGKILWLVLCICCCNDDLIKNMSFCVFKLDSNKKK